jgi:hypothetical protein
MRMAISMPPAFCTPPARPVVYCIHKATSGPTALLHNRFA